jgi:uncharacterized protein (DUF1810 family)
MAPQVIKLYTFVFNVKADAVLANSRIGRSRRRGWKKLFPFLTALSSCPAASKYVKNPSAYTKSSEKCI